ncbi:helix-turn-helix domain-containing protein [Halorientalis regularis]|jgi:predicted DNA binding protein|uniref:Predicted DNA binding protein, contains HTH domain n=1 Tax=Halorientalis regularis TaxID=660518 RepID=A0A1G7IQV4_9EURY|nr:helix-turn-helix domain-containing protein [Halorientalis regularis]SDF14934.1 Predicted DNA binding protein, contains HTH domain [Halorientalis regularis]
MREFDIVLRTEDGTYNPLDEAIVEHPELTREAALHFDLMSDGTSVLLYHLTGDADELEAILAEEESALSYDVFEVDDDGVRAHVRFAANTVLSAMIQLMDEYDLIIDPPVDIDDEGGLHMSVAGDFKKIREAARMRPGDLDIELQEDDSGPVDRVDVTTLLTERQLEVLEVALAKGYYEIPRQATNEDIAAELDCSTSTVGEHLRKIESRIISQVGPD